MHLELKQGSPDSRSVKGHDYQQHTDPGIQHLSSEERELSYHFNTEWETKSLWIRRNWFLAVSILRSLAHHLPCSWLPDSYFSSCRAWSRRTAAPWPGNRETVGLPRWSQLRLDKTHKSEVWEGTLSWTSLLIMVLKNTQHVDWVPQRFLRFLLSFSSPN